MTYHQMYRSTTLGNTLQEALDEMVEHKMLQSEAASKIIHKFDQCISNALAKRVKNRLTLRGHLNTYRFCDNVWTLVMNNVEIKDSSAIMTVDKERIQDTRFVAFGDDKTLKMIPAIESKIKIVACEGKSALAAKKVSSSSGAPDRARQNAPVTQDDKSNSRNSFKPGDELE